jgi:Fe-S-cluster containining protein
LRISVEFITTHFQKSDLYKGPDDMDNQMKPLGPDDDFYFTCSPEKPCFNECCRDLNQFLTPYDLLRLKNHFMMTSGDFIHRFVAQHVGPETGLPVMSLKPDVSGNLVCPFVAPDGCRVYPDRPSSCRMYPLARAISRHRETGRITEHYALLKEDHCFGFENGRKQNIRIWIKTQGLETYNRMNDLLMEIISLKNQRMPGPLSISAARHFHVALYDLDDFRRQIFENNLLADFEVSDDLMAQVKEDDLSLLELGHRWIRYVLFGPGT